MIFRYLLIVLFCNAFIVLAQTTTSKGLTTIKTKNGILYVNKTDNALNVVGELVLSDEGIIKANEHGVFDTKHGFNFILDKKCKLTAIQFDTSNVFNKFIATELTEFSLELFNQINTEQLEYLFQFDNDLGFVNEDSCSDNLTVSIKLVNVKLK